MIRVATATEFNREPSRLLRQRKQGDTILVNNCSKPVAALIPSPKATSGAELARQLSRMKRVLPNPAS